MPDANPDPSSVALNASSSAFIKITTKVIINMLYYSQEKKKED
jgi:hypothetical protein